MPCYDPRDDIEREERRRKEMPCTMYNSSNPADWLPGGDLAIKHNADALRRQLAEMEAMLCMVLRKLEREPHLAFTQQEYDEAGVPEHALQEWWNEHRRYDDTRRKKEAAQRETKRRVEETLKKLTPEERSLLGYPKT
jgi:hypothetical protein